VSETPLIDKEAAVDSDAHDAQTVEAEVIDSPAEKGEDDKKPRQSEE
jgi:hypothetical protein